MTTTNMITLPLIPGLILPEGLIPSECWADIACRPHVDQWAKGDLSGQSVDELSAQIASWTGCLEDLILMIMIAVSKDMDKAIKAKAEEVLALRKKAEGQKGADKSTEALDQATQELQQMQKQRDQFFQMFQKILDSLTGSMDKLLSSWRAA